MRGQPHHLREIAHGGLAAVVLPVGVGGKAGRRIPGEQWINVRLTCRIERQRALDALYQIEEQQSGALEEQHANGVGFPALFTALIHATCPVNRPLDRTKDRLKPGVLLLEDGHQVEAQRLRQQEQQGEEHKNLRHTVKCEGHGVLTASILKLVGPQQRHHEVDADAQGNQPGDDVLDHGYANLSLTPLPHTGRRQDRC